MLSCVLATALTLLALLPQESGELRAALVALAIGMLHAASRQLRYLYLDREKKKLKERKKKTTNG